MFFRKFFKQKPQRFSIASACVTEYARELSFDPTICIWANYGVIPYKTVWTNLLKYGKVQTLLIDSYTGTHLRLRVFHEILLDEIALKVTFFRFRGNRWSRCMCGDGTIGDASLRIPSLMKNSNKSMWCFALDICTAHTVLLKQIGWDNCTFMVASKAVIVTCKPEFC